MFLPVLGIKLSRSKLKEQEKDSDSVSVLATQRLFKIQENKKKKKAGMQVDCQWDACVSKIIQLPEQEQPKGKKKKKKKLILTLPITLMQT